MTFIKATVTMPDKREPSKPKNLDLEYKRKFYVASDGKLQLQKVLPWRIQHIKIHCHTCQNTILSYNSIIQNPGT